MKVKLDCGHSVEHDKINEKCEECDKIKQQEISIDTDIPEDENISTTNNPTLDLYQEVITKLKPFPAIKSEVVYSATSSHNFELVLYCGLKDFAFTIHNAMEARTFKLKIDRYTKALKHPSMKKISALKFIINDIYRYKYYDDNKDTLKNPRFRLIMAITNGIIGLISISAVILKFVV